MLYSCYNLNKSKASVIPRKVRRWLMAPHIHKETISMVKPGSDGSEYTRGYQQALDDFGITQLLSGIRSYSDEDFDAARAHDSVRARKLGGVSDSARRGESQR